MQPTYKYRDHNRIHSANPTTSPGRTRRLRRRSLIFGCLACILLFLYYRLSSPAILLPQETILRTAPLSDLVSRRYILFTTPIDNGEWPTLFDTKDRFISRTNTTSRNMPNLVFSGLPRSIGTHIPAKSGLEGSDFIFAMATDSTHVMADDFLPLAYLKETQTTLLVVLGPLDPVEIKTVQEYLDSHAIGFKAFVIRMPEMNKVVLKMDLLSILSEFKKYEQGQARYYTILDDDLFISSTSTFQSLLGQYNAIESHMIVDSGSIRDTHSKTPVTLTNALLDRIFARPEHWNNCHELTKSIDTALGKINKCVAMVQGITGANAKVDGESLMVRSVEGDVSGLLESGHQHLIYEPRALELPSRRVSLASPNSPSSSSLARPEIRGREEIPRSQQDLFYRILTDREPGLSPSSLFSRFSFTESDRIAYTYSHGYSITAYNLHSPGPTPETLKQTEVTWIRTPDEQEARDAPYYRAAAKAGMARRYLVSHVAVRERLGKRKDGQRKGVAWTSILYHAHATETEPEDEIQVDWVTSM